MLNNKSSIIMAVYILQLVIFSCKKKEEITNQQKSEKNIKKLIECKMEFPDTVYKDQLYDGMVKYKSVLDTITTSFDDKKKNRYVIFYLTIVDKPDPDYKHLKKVANKFGADNNREISIYDIKFTKAGNYYIDGIISDFVVIDNNKKDQNGNEIVRLIENEERLTHKVVVIENTGKK